MVDLHLVGEVTTISRLNKPDNDKELSTLYGTIYLLQNIPKSSITTNAPQNLPYNKCSELKKK